MNYNKLHRKLVGYNCSIFGVELKMRLPCIDVQSAADAVRLIKQAQSVRQGRPQALIFRLPCGEGNKTQNRSNGIVGKTYTHFPGYAALPDIHDMG